MNKQIELVKLTTIIHLFWIGKIKHEHIDYINLWKKFNPKYTIKLWYDSESTLTTELIESFNEKTLNSKGYIKERDRFFDFCKENDFKNKTVNNLINYYLKKPTPPSNPLTL